MKRIQTTGFMIERLFAFTEFETNLFVSSIDMDDSVIIFEDGKLEINGKTYDYSGFSFDDISNFLFIDRMND